jgi:predicted RNA polymerase sigma factor
MRSTIFRQAAIAACHARATTAEDTDWVRTAALYDGLAQITPSPVVELNRSVAIAQAFGPQAGLQIVLPLSKSPSFAGTTGCRRSPATCSAAPASMVVPGSTSSMRPR